MARIRSTATIAGLALVLLVALAQPALADGIIIIEPPVPKDPAYLTVKYHRVTVTIEDQVAITRVDQVFVNESRHRLEGTYVFPLPTDATINDFAMWVDGERLGGEMLSADEARRIYEDIVRRQRDPALLEYVGRNTFRARIYPIPPKSEKRVEIEYSQVLPVDNGLVSYRYPLDTERFSPRPIEDVSVHVEIRSRDAIKAVYSPSHDVAIDRRGDYRVAVGYEERDVRPDTDFQLYYTVAQEDVGLNLLSYRSPGEDEGFFLMLLAPQVEVDRDEIVSRDVLLVLDTSGSMRREKLEQAKRALAFILNRLHEGDRFNVVTFSTGVRAFSRGLEDASHRKDALAWVEELEAKGGTDINRAMLEALTQLDDRRADRPAVVIFMTDGLATEGVTDTEQILRNIQENAPEHVRIFSFGVGDDVNTILLDVMAREHRGASAYVRPGQSIEEEVSAFYAKVSTPLLSDVEVDFGEVHVEDMYPYPLPDLFAGTQVIMAGRYRGGGETTVTLGRGGQRRAAHVRVRRGVVRGAHVRERSLCVHPAPVGHAQSGLSVEPDPPARRVGRTGRRDRGPGGALWDHDAVYVIPGERGCRGVHRARAARDGGHRPARRAQRQGGGRRSAAPVRPGMVHHGYWSYRRGGARGQRQGVPAARWDVDRHHI